MKIRIPRIVGILNITEDSFSDGGQFLDPDRALKEALQLIEDGNDIVDIGAASSNPATKPVPPQVEMDRLRPVIDFLHSRHVPVSVDTFNPAVQKFALKNNVEYLNDIQGFPDATMYPVLADSDCKLIVMHSIQRLGPATVVETEPEQVWKGIIEFFEERLKNLQNAGIASQRLILDPGMGFFLGSNPETSIHVIKNIPYLQEYFHLPVLVGVSRKSFLSVIVGGRAALERGAATLGAEIYLSAMGVDYIRTHDGRALGDTLKVLKTLNGETFK